MNQQDNLQCIDCGKIDKKQQFNGIAGFVLCRLCHQLQGNLFKQYKYYRDQLYPQIDLIQQGLYLGNQDAALDQKTFQMTGVTAVCVCGSYLNSPYQNKYIYKIYQISDHPKQSILKYFQQNYEWIIKMKQQNRKILVHCAAGVSRSASFVIAYIMKSKKIKFQQARLFVQSKRPIICPNSGFVQQLQQYQKFIFQSKQQ